MGKKWAKVPSGWEKLTSGTGITVESIASQCNQPVEVVQAIADGWLQTINQEAAVLYALEQRLGQKISLRKLLDYESKFETV